MATLLHSVLIPVFMAVCLLFSAACGGSDPATQADEAQAALSTGDYSDARDQAEAGLKAAGSTDKNLAWKLERIRVEALARQGETAEVSSSLERLAQSFPTQCDASFYSKVGGYLAQAGEGEGALEVAHAGQQRFPDRKADFDALIEELKQTAASGDAELTAKLKSLGYL
jgi:hypothetical protein